MYCARDVDQGEEQVALTSLLLGKSLEMLALMMISSYLKKTNHAALQLVAPTHTVLSLSSQKADPVKMKIVMKVRES